MTTRIHTSAMTAYSFIAVDQFDIVDSFQWIDCPDDAIAAETGASLLSETCDIEVWDVGRLVCKCSYAAARERMN